MITSDRDIFVGAHLTLEDKEHLREEAKSRKISMSALISNIISKWLATGTADEFKVERSNKREARPDPSGLRDVPLPLDSPDETKNSVTEQERSQSSST